MPKKGKKVEVELEDLAIMVKEGFDEVHRTLELKTLKDKTEFEQVHSAMAHLESEIKGVKAEVKGVKTDLEEVKEDIGDIKRRLSNLDNRLDTFVNHEKRLVKVEHELNLSP